MSKKFKDELQNMYVEMLSEGSKAPGDVDAGRSFVDSEADVSGKGYKDTGPESSDADISPEEADENLHSRVKGKTVNQKGVKKGGKTKTAKKADDIMGESSFDKLYGEVMVEEMPLDPDENPVETDEFSDDLGDFPEAGDEEDVEGEEVDVATELELIINRLKEIHAQIGGEEISDEEDILGAGEEEFGDEEIPVESVNATPEPLNANISELQKNKIVKKGGVKAKGKKAVLPASRARTGELSVAPNTTLGPQMSMKAPGSGPAADAKNASALE